MKIYILCLGVFLSLSSLIAKIQDKTKLTIHYFTYISQNRNYYVNHDINYKYVFLKF